MKRQNKKTSLVSRRQFIGTAAAAATALSIVPVATRCKGPVHTETPEKSAGLPDSRFGGVQIGTITYSWRDQPGGVENILKYCREAGISSIELMSDAIESWAGKPPSPTELPGSLPPEAQARLDNLTKQYKSTPEQIRKSVDPPVWQMIVAMIVGTTAEQLQWRLSVPVTKFEELRKMFNDAGVGIHIAKFSPAGWSDGEIDYAFKAAKALGAKGVTDESGVETAKRLGPFAEKHGMFAIMHNHYQFADKNFNVDEVLAASPAIMLNFDCGHYFGSTGLNPVDFIEKYHDRIFSLHLKDKTGPNTDPPNENQVWGQGEVPLADVLLLLKKHADEDGWPKHADIELEYPVKIWSNSVKEVRTCLAYARQILV
ncbi:MAG: TIM barrel protein [Bacteroidales bacterium]|jgi:sugar phosphate isomerase/epimerase|nr:TIM barrel protein [Bacteroidales bacterium]HQG76140.1 sugar phosphate isomerase/epimerase [Bacteroidales bacterium]